MTALRAAPAAARGPAPIPASADATPAARDTGPEPGRRRLTAGLVRWHVGLGELGLRLFLLHLLWIVGTLAGAGVLGLFPATAAVHAVLRADQREAALERDGAEPPSRPGLWREFWAAWRAELVRANLLGAGLAALWAVIAADRLVLGARAGAAAAGADAAGADALAVAAPWASGIVVVLTVVLALVSAVIWPVAAHFSDPLPRIWRMSLTLLVARIPLTIALAAVLGASVWLLSSMPGLMPVFGLALPCWAITALIWRSGVLPTR